MIEGIKLTFKGSEIAKRLKQIAAREERKAGEAKKRYEEAVSELGDMSKGTTKANRRPRSATELAAHGYTGLDSLGMVEIRNKAEAEKSIMESHSMRAIKNNFLADHFPAKETYLLSMEEVERLLDPTRRFK